MVQRDEWGYILRIVSHTPFHPWARITAALAQSLDGNREKPGVVSSVGVYAPKFGLGSLENPKMVGRGEVDVGITNPPITAKLAMEGIGPYRESVGSLRAIARFPEPDYIFWLVDEKLGIASMEDIPRRKPRLTLVSGRICPTGPDTITWTIEEVMKRYGFNYQDIASWGGKVLFPGQATIGVPIVKKHHAFFQKSRLRVGQVPGNLLHPTFIGTGSDAGNMDFDYRSFDGVALVGMEVPAIAVRTDSGWKTLKEFAAAAKKQKLKVGISGRGSFTHLASAALFNKMGMDVVYVPYGKGSAPVELLGGRIDAALQCADEALYEAKAQGRDCVRLASPSPDPVEG